jgi:23S rRNA (uracil1939-C5)-methyltransferase
VLELRVDSFAHGGNGVARLEGYVVFVKGAVPGDVVQARVTRSKRDYAEATAVEIVEPSPDRIEPRAQHPGAPWQVIGYERQVEEKQRQVREALERLGGFESPPIEPMTEAVEQWRYRNKLEYSFGEDERGGLVLGFHHAGRWDVIDDVEDDILASERINQVREAAKAWCREEGLSGWDRNTQSGILRNLVVREARKAGQVQAHLVTAEGDFASDDFAAALPAESILWTRTSAVSEITTTGDTDVLAGQKAIEEELEVLGNKFRFRISPDAFFQTNTLMAEKLYGAAAELAGLTGRERVLDLFCGIGTIGIALAPHAGSVIGVELVPQAVKDATQNARLNGIDNARFMGGDVRTTLRPLLEEAGQADVVVVDPPRAGLSQKVVRRVLEAGAQRIVYVSCNPTTLAPNARQIVDAGFELKTVRPVDMFPQTPHIEAVALFERG